MRHPGFEKERNSCGELMVRTGNLPDSLGPQGMCGREVERFLHAMAKAHARKRGFAGAQWERSSGKPLQ